MMARVAVDGEVVATAGTTFPYAVNGAPVADSGTWQPGPISYEKYPELLASGPVIWKATCTFTLAGGKLGNSAVSASETVELVAEPHPLLEGAHSVLVHGDSETIAASGNKLEVVAAASALFTV